MSFRTTWDYLGFYAEVIRISRFRYDSDTEMFLSAVEETGRHRTFILPAGTTLYRAQLNHRETEDVFKRPIPSAPKRMRPEPQAAREGRVNPKGIPCLYLADKPYTAMSEVRPWLGAYVSIGHFVTQKDLELMDCTAPRDEAKFNDAQNDEEQEEYIWGEISNAFSEPVTDSDTKADYTPTQVLAEVFKKMGCNGIKYRSLLGEEGNSFALFDLNDAKLVSCGLCTIEGISHKFSEERRVYDVMEDGSELLRAKLE